MMRARELRATTHSVVINYTEGCGGLLLRPDISESHEAMVLHAIVPGEPLLQLDPLVVVGVTTSSTAV